MFFLYMATKCYQQSMPRHCNSDLTRTAATWTEPAQDWAY